VSGLAAPRPEMPAAPDRPRAGRARALALRAPRAAPDPAALARRRLAIAILKRVLPVGALGVLALIAFWPEIGGIEDRVRVAYRKPDSAVTDSARLVAPRYTGRDERGRPYELAAEAAEQPSGATAVALTRPTGEITLEDGAWVTLQAERGTFERETRLLDLAGEVALFHDAGYEIRTDRARIDLAAGRAEGDAPVAAQGPPGTLDAAGFRIEERGAVVVFTGPARMVLVPAEAQP
jgi:lipopolysaccharide export system protein LptC